MVSMRAQRRAVLSLGANLGDRLATIDAAVGAIETIEELRVLARSGAWESPSWHPEGAGLSPDYVNIALLITTSLEPLSLLDELSAIEDALGRVRDERWGSRTIDIDIVTMGGIMRAGDRLVLPHPRAHQRQFVLQPWLEIEPDGVLPGRGPISELADYADGDAWRIG